MKVWQLIMVQLWVLCFAPAWAFVLVFAPLVLSPPNPSWLAFSLLIAPPVIAFIGSIALWLAKWKNNLYWQKILAVILIIFPIVSSIPLFMK